MAVAEVLDFPGGERVDDADDGSVGAAVEVVLDRLRDLPVDDGAAQARAAIQRLEMAETEMVARKLDAGAGAAAARRAAGAGGDRSKRDADKVKKRADAVRANPTLMDETESGDLSVGQLDAIAEGAARTDGAAATDPDLLDRVRRTENPDQARAAVRAWEDARAEQDDIDDTNRRHRAKRGMRRFVTRRGTSALMLEGDKTSIDQMEGAICARADALYEGDGGRDVPAHKHRRTHAQRAFDAAHDLLCATVAAANAPQTPATRATVHVTAGIDDLYGDGMTPATLLGSGPLPSPELERFGCFADLVGTIFGGDGEVLWHGRRLRTATPAQWDALIARDGGCVLCDASPQRCEAHHLTPFNAPARGPTDIDNLALVCTGCHRHLHNTSLTLTRSPDRGWHTRPATPDERAPKRGPSCRGGS